MGVHEHDEVGDNFQAGVSDVGRPPALAPAPRGPRLTRRQRALRLTSIAAALFLALLVILSSVPVVRNRAVGLVFPTPTPTLAPGSDLFYLLPNPPGTTVLLDGHVLARAPLLGDPQPLRLARGRHRLAWRNSLFPFQPQRCTLLVPSPPANTQINDSCLLVDPRLLLPYLVTTGSPALRRSVIAVRESLATLPNDQATALADTIQATLDASRSSAIVRPGEHYFYSPAVGNPGQVVTATQSLRATLSFQVVVNGQLYPAPEPCVSSVGVRPCRFPGQDCARLCTWPGSVAPAGAAPEWIAAAFAQPSWDYTTLDGRQVAPNQSEFGFNRYLVMLRITWDGAHWHVTPIIGHRPDLPPADDLLCGPALDWVSQPPFGYSLGAAAARGYTLQYASAATPVGGCVVRVTGNVSAPALFLERFGVLLVASGTMGGCVVPQFPCADATEQALAQQLAAQLGP